MKKHTMLAAAGLLVVILGLTLWSLSPRVTGIQTREQPLHGPQPLEIHFSRVMDPSSTAQSLSIVPDVEGEIRWNTAGDTLTFTPDQPWPSGTSIAVEVSRGPQSRLRLPLLNPTSWRLEVSPYLMTYLWPADGNGSLFALNPETGESRELISHPAGIQDYEITQDGMQVYFSALTRDGVSTIYRYDRGQDTSLPLISCPGAICQNPSPSPEGRWLLYERIPQRENAPPGIVLYSLGNGESLPVGDPEHRLENPRWSPGTWFSYYDASDQIYQIINPDTGEQLSFANETGGEGTWSPAGPSFVTTEIFNLTDTLATRHLMKFSIRENSLADLTGDQFLEDANPAYSPSGDYLAFGRKSVDPEEWTPGRQIWLLEDGRGQAFPLTSAVDYNHTGFAWHPSELQLAYVRYNQAQLFEPPEIWLIQRSGEETYRLVINGYAPDWIP